MKTVELREYVSRKDVRSKDQTARSIPHRTEDLLSRIPNVLLPKGSKSNFGMKEATPALSPHDPVNHNAIRMPQYRIR